MKIYIAGKITGDKGYREKFAAVEAALWAQGFTVIYGYFGEGHNINMDTLETKGYWSNSHGGTYPALIRLTPDEFKEILREGNVDVDNVIID